MFDFLRILVQFFEKHNIPYMLSGSMAMSTYTGPRFTRDFDFVTHLKPGDALLMANHFKEGYYCDLESINDAIRQKGMFNIIDHKSNYKADFIILKDDSFRITEFERRKKIGFLDLEIFIVSPEDLLISKLIWIQHLQSPLQAEDVRALSRLDDLNWLYIKSWVKEMKLNTFDLLNP